jgi:hypothetical protein
MSINHVFYKNNLIAEIEKTALSIRTQLFEELIAAGSDQTKYKRRIRMLRHLNLIQAQLLHKVYEFFTDDPSDYLELGPIIIDLHTVTARNA